MKGDRNVQGLDRKKEEAEKTKRKGKRRKGLKGRNSVGLAQRIGKGLKKDLMSEGLVVKKKGGGKV